MLKKTARSLQARHLAGREYGAVSQVSRRLHILVTVRVIFASCEENMVAFSATV